MNDRQRNLIQLLFREYEVTFAEEAGIILKNEPAPLYQLLVLSLLLSAPIPSGQAARAARALRIGNLSMPEKTKEATWQRRFDVLASHGYGRHAERTSTQLGHLGERVLSTYQGDLRRLEQQAAGDTTRARELLQEFEGLGQVGATIFLCEAHDVWRALAPPVDQAVLETATELGLAQSQLELTHLVPPGELSQLVSALVRVRRSDLAGEVLRRVSI